jgi:hypothetical protein
LKLTFKGIGWLIFGLLIIASSFETYGWADKLSTIGIGLTLVLVYVMKQFFKPRWYGFFIAGGIMLSFCIYNGINEELIMPLAIAVACLGAFYVLNKRSVDAIVDDIDSLGDDEIENFDYVAPESYEDAATSSTGTDGNSSDVEADSAKDADSSDEDGAIEIETKIPAPKAKTVEFDFEPKKSKKKE